MRLPVLKYPNPVLRQKSDDVAVFDDSLKELTKNMLETMYSLGGIGISAIQVGVPQKIIVIDLSSDQNQPQVFINAQVTAASAEQKVFEEGCLSFPGIFEKVKSNVSMTVSYQDVDGNQQTIVAEGLLATVLGHEMDHTKGVMIVDRVNPKKRAQIKTKMMGGK